MQYTDSKRRDDSDIAGPHESRLASTSRAIRVFVVDDHPMFVRGLSTTLSSDRSFVCVGEAGDGAEAVSLAPVLRPDVVLIDMAMPGMDGVEVMTALREPLPHARFVLFTTQLDPAEVRRAIAAGASCVLLKSASPKELISAVQAVHCGLRLHSPALTEAMAAGAGQPALGADLTRRERSLLVLMSLGLSNREIAERMHIAMPTVKFHVTNILAKLNVDNRTTAVLVALRHKLVEMDAPLSVSH
jgi:two-component system, NarL family, response regulator LiaR